jgi:hypothetical protein
MEGNSLEIHGEIPPLDAKGNFKRKFEVKMRPLGPDPRRDGLEKAVFVDGKKLDFQIDVLRFLEAKQRGGNHLANEQRKIEKEFTKAVSEAVGRRVTTEEIKKATLEGWI